MSKDLNKVILIVRLVRDPEIKHTPSGTTVCSFSVASSNSYLQSGEKKEQVSYFDCVAWDKLGEISAEYLKKGSSIAIEGRLVQNRWDDQDGKKRSKVEIVLNSFQFLGGKKDGEKHESADGSLGTPVNLLDEQNPFSDDDIPF